MKGVFSVSKSTYYAARALGRAVVREKNRARREKERAMKKHPELFQKEQNNEDSSFFATIISIILIIMFAIIYCIVTY